MQIGWHYTTGDYFRLIIESGFLRPEVNNVFPPNKPVLWFSSNEYFEQSVCRSIFVYGEIHSLTMLQTERAYNGLYRFGYPLKTLLSWQAIKENAGIPLQIANALEQLAHNLSAYPEQWYGVFHELPLSQCLRIQVLKSNTWIDISGINQHPTPQNESGQDFPIQMTFASSTSLAPSRPEETALTISATN